MTFDFRASQLRTSKIIASGSTGTNAQLLLYPIAADGTPANQGNIDPVTFGTGSIGEDVWFFVSGALDSLDGTSRGVAAFGGDVHISGNLRVESVENGGNFGPIQVGILTTTDATPGIVWSTTLADYAIQNINLTLVGKQTNNANVAKFNREFTIYKTTGSVAFTDFINVYVPDYQSDGTWGFSLVLSGSDMQLYATGSAGVNVFWKSQALINSITSN
jgi:hypothetical protein